MIFDCTGRALLQRWKKLVMSMGLKEKASSNVFEKTSLCKGFLPQVLITGINFPYTAHMLQNFTCLFCFFPDSFL